MAITRHGTQLSLNRWLLKVSGASTRHTESHGRTKWGQVEFDVDNKTREMLPPPFTDGELPQPTFYIHQLLMESCDPAMT